jgi:hypothetical protein
MDLSWLKLALLTTTVDVLVFQQEAQSSVASGERGMVPNVWRVSSRPEKAKRHSEND